MPVRSSSTTDNSTVPERDIGCATTDSTSSSSSTTDNSSLLQVGRISCATTTVSVRDRLCHYCEK